MSKKCTQCKTTQTQNTETMKDIPLVSAECEATRQHKIIKLVVFGWIMTILLLFGSNLAWIVYESQFENVVETYNVDLEQDTENGNNNCIVNGGEICNGTSESQD